MATFRAKARAVELLGKGQIADLPTAISELWKNGYDAYGNNLEASLYMRSFFEEPILVISDDGKGMDREDILNRWFVLGTDSKSRNESDKKGADTLGKAPRIKMGEKGIGRLAVAYLGPQMLMMSKKINHSLEAAFFDWRILENYNLFLSEVQIPLRSIDSASDFKKTVEKLKKEFLANFSSHDTDGSWNEQKELRDKIISDCAELEVPDEVINDCVEDLFKNPTKNHGTKFIIFKPEEQILDLPNFTKDVDSRATQDDTTVKHTVASLVGLFNQFKTEEPEYQTRFWVNEDSELPRYDLLNLKSFFAPGDFDTCDHLIEGAFDKEGSFSGNVRIYNKNVSHKFKPNRRKGNTNYGAFNIRLGYVQSVGEQTMLNDEQKRVFEEKLSFYGGLFVYRDGFRVLPYGRPDADFLEFEDRRSRSAGDYFFSARRMFGYIEISRNENKNLKDKSSREGFINNAAYRDFKADLISFFKDLAKKYFATKAQYNYKQEQQDALISLARAEKQENERDKEARKNFARQLSLLPQQLATEKAEFNNLIRRLEKQSSDPRMQYENVRSTLSAVEASKIKIAELSLRKPVRFEPTELQKKNFSKYSKEHKAVLIFTESFEELLSNIREKLKVHELFQEYEARCELYRNRLAVRFDELEQELESVLANLGGDFRKEKSVFLTEFDEKSESVLPDSGDPKDISRSMKLLRSIFSEIQERIVDRVSPYIQHLKRVSFDVDEDSLVGFYKLKFEEIEREWRQTYELAQLGIAVEVIDHQFNTLYSQLAESIETLKEFMLSTKDADKRYRTLRTAFEHLQENYKLLQPLYRTTGKVRRDITGSELKEYMNDFFGDRLQENEILLSITPSGKKWSVFSYESIFKPVLINIVNNAVYWLQSADKREIRIDAKGGNLLIMNSGTPIEDYQLDDIFKLFYSGRPNGRGIGLYLAKQSLNAIGFNISATNETSYNQLDGACFSISEFKK